MFCSPAYNKVVYCYVMIKLYFLIAGLSVFGCKLFIIPVSNIQKSILDAFGCYPKHRGNGGFFRHFVQIPDTLHLDNVHCHYCLL